MFRSQLLYGMPVRGAAYSSYTHRIKILQNKAIRIVAGSKWSDHLTPYYRKNRNPSNKRFI